MKKNSQILFFKFWYFVIDHIHNINMNFRIANVRIKSENDAFMYVENEFVEYRIYRFWLYIKNKFGVHTFIA